MLINLPPEEKEFPRILNNIKDAWWFYSDEWKVDTQRYSTLEKKFAQKVFKLWSFLRPHLPNFSNLWKEYKLYKSQIPSYGALIFNKTRDKLLFILYHNPRDRIPRKLDFPKGKVDQGEEDLECSLREIYEETGLILSEDQINARQFVRVETI
jgi:mRNA-decapping enzyme subunit 2